ncbi:unnamed protein product [Bemisia tabaci]|uniref:Uncharacterized protein n=1 Tax=Bemisia tabaci TaxID=7038 RepID=A0A9P0F7G4_BEMTA|nr:unnamed protein product [Bemisia tabaci]
MKMTTHRWHQLVGRPDSGDPILVQVLLNEPLHGLVPLHKRHITQINTEEDGRLVPVDLVVAEEADEREEAGRVEGAVAEQRPPRQRQDRVREDGAHPDDEEDVEDGRADDRADPDVVEGHEHSDDTGEELGGRPPGGHERRPGHVVGDLELLDDDVQRGDEELVADDGQRHEHVDDAQDVDDDGAATPLLQGERVGREERLLLLHMVPGARRRRGGGRRERERGVGHQEREVPERVVLVLVVEVTRRRGQGQAHEGPEDGPEIKVTRAALEPEREKQEAHDDATDDRPHLVVLAYYPTSLPGRSIPP